MPKTFYTERDIEDLVARGVTSLVVNDDIVVTDLAREKAMKMGFELIREHDQPDSAPIRPYIAKTVAKKSTSTMSSSYQVSKSDLEAKVLEGVKARVGDSVDSKLLETIVKRVLQSVGGK
jgi:hypothetical protein